eukprot:SAG22_NODE_53_length_24242_cov_158.884231_11_plen_164_part_00
MNLWQGAWIQGSLFCLDVVPKLNIMSSLAGANPTTTIIVTLHCAYYYRRWLLFIKSYMYCVFGTWYWYSTGFRGATKFNLKTFSAGFHTSMWPQPLFTVAVRFQMAGQRGPCQCHCAAVQYTFIKGNDPSSVHFHRHRRPWVGREHRFGLRRHLPVGQGCAAV